MSIGRREFLQAGAATLAGAALAACTSGERSSTDGSDEPAVSIPGVGRPPNIVVILTDQQRTTQHWPEGWAAEHEPSLDRLERHGLTFANHFVAATQCTPSRSTILTGTYPWANGVTATFSSFASTPLQSHQTTIARVLTEAGYEVAWKGKWHLSESVMGTDTVWNEHDIENLAQRYGVPAWTPPDAGNSLTVASTAGGGSPDNDGRIVAGVDPAAAGQTRGWGESALDFLERMAASDRPFALFVSLVNPHDIGFFPKLQDEVGYDPAAYGDVGISLPDNFDDDLTTKPAVQAEFMRVFTEHAAPIETDEARLAYVNLYAYLHGVVDRHVTAVLDALDSLGLTEETLVVRTADHGEQAMSHRMIEKMYQAYDETMRVPLVVSNPLLFPEPARTESFSSLIDLFPTVAALAGADGESLAGLGLAGRSLAPVIEDPSRSVRDAVHFTYDDFFGASEPGFERNGEPSPVIDPSIPGHIRAIRERDWKYAVYFTTDGSALQYEMYDLVGDPLETVNLAFEPTSGDPELEAERQRLHRRLTEQVDELGTRPLGFDWPESSGVAAAAQP